MSLADKQEKIKSFKRAKREKETENYQKNMVQHLIYINPECSTKYLYTYSI